MTDGMTDDDLRIFFKLYREPITELRESEQWLGFPGKSLAISKREPMFTIGYASGLRAASRFYKRWFDLPDLGKRGWAIIFRLYDAGKDVGGQEPEYFGGWVPPEDELKADQWIARLNDEIRARLATKTTGAGAAPSSSSGGGVLEAVGEFRETAYQKPDAPSLVDARGKRPPAHKAEVLAYLRTAKSITFSPGLNADFFDPSQWVKGETLRTDGTYFWPDYLGDYVERYDVELPAKFEEHMRERCWKLPEGLDVRTLQLPPR